MKFKFTYSGKHGAPVIKIKYLHRVLKDAANLLETATQQKNLDLMETWFGKNNFEKGETGKLTVLTGLGDMKKLMESEVIECVSRETNSIAFADKASFDSEKKLYGRLQINLGSYFGRKWFTHGERVASVLHELSHATPELRTEDIESRFGHKAYKGRCLDLAGDKDRFSDALRNAENWMYFIAGHYESAGFKKGGSDWSRLEKSVVNAPDTRDTKLKTKDDRDVVIQGKTWKGFTPYEKYHQWPGYITVRSKKTGKKVKIVGWKGNQDRTAEKPVPRMPGKPKKPKK